MADWIIPMWMFSAGFVIVFAAAMQLILIFYASLREDQRLAAAAAAAANAPERAIAMLEKSTREDPRDALAASHLGSALYVAGRRVEAEREFRRALEIEPLLPDALYGVGFCLLESDPEESFRHFDAASRLDENNAAVWKGRGLANIARKQFTEAAADFLRALEEDSGRADLYVNLGVAHTLLGEPASAEAAYRHALALQPDNFLALSNLSALLGMRRKDTEAMPLYENALRTRPDAVKERIEFAQLLARNDRLQEAVVQMEEAIRLEPENADAQFRLAVLYERLGRKEDAARCATRAETLDPSLRTSTTRRVVQTKEGELMTSLKYFGAAPMFHGIAEEDIQRLAGVAKERVLEGGEILFREGDKAESLFLIVEGSLCVNKKLAGGREETIVRLTPGNVTGEMPFFDLGVRSATLTAGGKTRALEIPFAALEVFLESRPSAGARMMRNIASIMAERIRAMDDEVRDKIVWGFSAAASS